MLNRNKIVSLRKSAIYSPLSVVVMGLALIVGEQAAQAQVAAQDDSLGDIVVTAQKRAESINDVPVSMAALGGDRLNDLGYTRAQEIFQQIPNVSFRESGGIPQLNIRGVQLNDFGNGNEPPIGYYVDEVYLGTLGGHISDIFDVERVEVLKGPQGTLFGRNTTGGLVHWITKKPTDEFEGYGAVQYGSYDQISVEGAVGGPLSQNVRGRVAVKYLRDDGWQKNLAIPGSRFSKDNNLSGRAHLDVDLSDDVTVLFNFHGSRIRGRSNAVVLMGLRDPSNVAVSCSDARALSGACVSVNGSPSTLKNPKRVYSDIPKLVQNLDTLGGFARVTANLSDKVELVSISAYEYVKRFYDQDADGSTVPLFYNFQSVKARQYSQELRLSGSAEGFRWILGAFYYRDHKGDLNFGVPQVIPAGSPGLGLRNQADIKTESWAAFGQVDVDLTDTLSATIGGRYTDESKKLRLSNDFAAPAFLDNEKISDGVFTYRTSLNYKPAEDTLIYLSASKGFKSGAFKTTFARQGEGKAAGTETLFSYELGLKSVLIPRRLSVNLTGFYNDYKDLQVASVGERDGVPGSFLLNVGDAKVYGMEAEATFVLFSGFDGSLGLGLLDTKIKSANPVYDGNREAMAPSFRANGLLRYTPDVDVLSGKVTLQVNGTYMGKQFLAPENQSNLIQKSYFIAGSNISWTDQDRHLTASLFVNNIFDKAYATGGYQQLGLGFNGLFYGKPRIWGVRAGYSW